MVHQVVLVSWRMVRELRGPHRRRVHLWMVMLRVLTQLALMVEEVVVVLLVLLLLLRQVHQLVNTGRKSCLLVGLKLVLVHSCCNGRSSWPPG